MNHAKLNYCFMPTHLRFFLIVPLLIFFTGSLAQSEVDSITRLIGKEKDLARKNALYLERAIYYSNKDNAKAFSDINKALDYYSSTNNRKGSIDAWNSKAKLLISLKKIESALYFDSLAYTNAEPIRYEKGLFLSYFNQSTIHKSQGKLADAELDLARLMELIPKLKNELKPEIVMDTYNRMGAVKSGLGKYDEAIDFLNKSLELARTQKKTDTEIYILINFANTYNRIGSYQKAIEYHLKAIRLAEMKNDTRSLLKIYNNIAITYKKLNEYEKALDYYNKAFQLAESHKIYKTMGLSSMNMGVLYVQLKNYKKAEELFKNAINYLQFTQDARDLGLANHNYGNFLLENHRDDLAEEYLKKGLEYRIQTDSKPEIAKSLASLGKLKLNQNQLKEAEKYLLETEDLLNGDDQSIDVLFDLYVYLKELYLKQNDYRKAFEYQQKEIELRQIRFNESEKVNALKIQTEYELDKKDQILKSEQENQRRRQVYIFSIGGFFFLLLILFLVVLLQRRRQIRERHSAELVQLEQQHRLSLADSLAKAEQEERKKIANKLHDETVGILSIAKLNVDQLDESVFVAGSDAGEKLKATKKLLGEATESIRNISHTLMPVALEKYGLKPALQDLVNAVNASGKIKVEEVMEGLDDTKSWNPQLNLTIYRMVHEVFNNIIKHAQATHVFLQVIELDDSITIYIEDNGKGLKQDKLSQDGIGLNLLRQNIEYLNGRVEINGKENKGTFVLAELPIAYQNLS